MKLIIFFNSYFNVIVFSFTYIISFASALFITQLVLKSNVIYFVEFVLNEARRVGSKWFAGLAAFICLDEGEWEGIGN